MMSTTNCRAFLRSTKTGSQSEWNDYQGRVKTSGSWSGCCACGPSSIHFLYIHTFGERR